MNYFITRFILNFSPPINLNRNTSNNKIKLAYSLVINNALAEKKTYSTMKS